MKDKFTDYMLDIIPTWKTIDNIINELNTKYDYSVNERLLRKTFENYNEEYNAHLTNGYNIAHGCKGYKITKDYEEMQKSDKDLYKRSMKMLARVSHNKRTRGEDMHLFKLELVQDIKKATDETAAVN